LPGTEIDSLLWTLLQLSTEYAVQQLLENVKVSSRSEVDRLELFDHVLLHSDVYFNSSQVPTCSRIVKGTHM
jgi:hypothetical protein